MKESFSMRKATEVAKALAAVASKEKAAFYPTFFKTAKGQYGEGIRFIGVTVPKQRIVAKQSLALPASETSRLLRSPIHEHKLCALLILVHQYRGSQSPRDRRKIFNFAKKHISQINNWDLVDTVAPAVFGEHWVECPQLSETFYTMAGCRNLWRRRIAIVATFAWIRKGRYDHTFALAKRLLRDEHDLIHKAVGWMLRECGKRDMRRLQEYLDRYAIHMPRTMLRYSIERFPEHQRQYYLKKRS